MNRESTTHTIAQTKTKLFLCAEQDDVPDEVPLAG